MLRRAWNRLFAVIAVGTTALAVLVTVARLLLPQLAEHREELEAWISRTMQQPVRIERLEAQWRGWTPSLELDGVALLDRAGRRVVTRLDHVSVSIAVLRSIARRELVPGRLGVSGVRLSLVRGADGAVTIEGVAPASPQRPGSRQNALAHWLLNRDDLAIESASLVWRDDRFLLRPVVFSNVALTIRRDGEHRQVHGSAALPKEVGRSLEFVLDAHGDLLTPRWNGRWYVRGRDLSPQLLLNFQELLGLRVDEGRVGFEVWSDWRGARLTRVRGRFRAAGVSLGLEQGRLAITGAHGALVAERTVDRAWRIVLGGLGLSTQNGAWPETTLAMTIRPGVDGGPPDVTAQATFLRLDDIAPLIPYVRALPADLRQALTRAQPRGDVRDVRGAWHPRHPPRARFSLRARFADVITRPFGDVPGINALSGTLDADGEGGSLALAPRSMQLTAPRRLSEPLWLDRVGGRVTWRRGEDGWLVDLDHVALATDAAELELGGQLAWRTPGGPHALLALRIVRGDLAAARALLPAGMIPERGRRWLQQALVGGRITGGAAILRGPLDRFPFAHGEGVFELRFTVEDGILDFSHRWPRAEEVAADVVFRGHTLTVEAAAARIMGARLRDVSARIDDLARRRKAVVLSGHASASAADARRLVAASPLAGSVGRRLEAVDLAGGLDLELELTVPLYPAERVVGGHLRLDDMTVRGRGLGVTLEQVSGVIDFDRRRWSGRDLAARYLDHPVRAAIEGAVRGGPVTVTLSGTGGPALLLRTLERTAPPVAEWLHRRDLLSRVSGETAWQARLTLPAEGSRRRLEVTSDLAGVAFDLPPPLDKRRDQSLPLTFHLDSDPREPLTLTTAVRGRLAVSARFTAPEGGHRRLDAAAIAFGPAAGVPETPREGIRLSGTLPAVRADDWLGLAGNLSPGGPAWPLAADLEFAALELWGQRLAPLSLRADLAPGSLLALELEAPQASGSIELPLATDGAPLRARLSRLTLTPSPDAAGPDLDPTALPPLDIAIDRLRYGDSELGRARLLTRPASDGMVVEALELADTDYTVRGSGAWLAGDGVQQSRCHLDTSADELQTLLARFGYPQQAIEGGPVHLVIDAAWPGSPMQFALARLSGRLRLQVGAGSLREVRPNAGRLFGLLSIQSLARRLTLDFQDLFGEGLSFDRISGEFELEQGNAYTRDLVVEGPSLRIQVQGRTGLASRDYDQTAVVTPQLSSSLPVASALFGPAGVAAGAALFLGQKVFKGLPERIDAIFARRYRITGPWDDPVIERVKDTDVSLAD